MSKIADITMIDRSPEVLEAVKKQIEIGLEAIGQEGEGYAKDDCPVDTGRLRNSIAHKVEWDGVYIGTNVEYAPYVEYRGKVKHTTGKAHFLRDAAANHGEHYKAILTAALKGGE